MIYCDFNYCIYNEEGECTLSNINISSLGICDDCITPDIDDETLSKIKKDLLATLNSTSRN